MKPSELLDESRILLDVEGSVPKDALIRRLADIALKSAPEKEEPIIADLLAREAKMTTGIGQGIAIPHTRSLLVDRPVAALAVSREGVDFQALDGEPVHIIFEFLTPQGDPALHIQTLGQTAALFADESVREALQHASNPAEVLEIMRSHGG